MVDCSGGCGSSSTGPLLVVGEGFTRFPPLLSLFPPHVMGGRAYDPSCGLDNCSGHGECQEGRCFCEVQFSGGTCTDPNLSYFIAFSTIFYFICGVSLLQLILCIKSEFSRMKSPSIFRACRVTTQKALYLLICIATAIRGFYFSSPENARLRWTSSLMSAYYPVLLTGSSLIVCFWAEVFHLRDLRLDTPRFLSKSFLGFVAFNIITYSLLLAELVLLQFTNSTDSEKDLLSIIFNSCYAVLMLIVVIFFLIYGVEVFFKVRGGFTNGGGVSLGCAHGGGGGSGAHRVASSATNASQLHQSRLGLVSQALLLLVTAGFMMSDVLGSLWKDKVPVLSRNYHNVIFRVVELGVALWFPCVLWNCFRPEQLWILNPKKILQKLEVDRQTQQPGSEAEALVSSPHRLGPPATIVKSGDKGGGVGVEGLGSCEKLPECFICYDSERLDAGQLIQPCACKGDVSAVHHDCLKKWLVESSDNPDNNRCKVCNDQYELERERVCFPRGVSPSHWLQTAAIVCVMSTSAAGACLVVKMFENVELRTLAVGVALLVEYVCLRFLGFNVLLAYQRAKFSAVKILGRKSFPLPPSHNAPLRRSSSGSNNSSNCLHSPSDYGGGHGGHQQSSVMTVRLSGEHIETILEQTPMISSPSPSSSYDTNSTSSGGGASSSSGCSCSGGSTVSCNNNNSSSCSSSSSGCCSWSSAPPRSGGRLLGGGAGGAAGAGGLLLGVVASGADVGAANNSYQFPHQQRQEYGGHYIAATHSALPLGLESQLLPRENNTNDEEEGEGAGPDGREQEEGESKSTQNYFQKRDAKKKNKSEGALLPPGGVLNTVQLR